MDYSYRLTRLFSDVDELLERQRKLERYVQYLLGKKADNLGKLEKKISEQEKHIEKLKERTELMAKDNLRLKDQVKKLTEVVEYLVNKQKRDERLETL
ncbi:MAG: hypothetical protein HXS46_14035 [Theionarchaea archaeon]|nr:hypothetical protein [Theionarchaea archaeon]